MTYDLSGEKSALIGLSLVINLMLFNQKKLHFPSHRDIIECARCVAKHRIMYVTYFLGRSYLVIE